MTRCYRHPAASLLTSAMLALATESVAAAVTIHVVDSEGAPLQHAVVTTPGLAVSHVPGERTPAKADRTVTQVGQQFEPRVTVVQRGTQIHFPNTDITQHHVYSFSEAKQFELELYAGDDLDPVRFDRTGIVAIGCNIHDWMLGYIVVTNDAFFGVTGSDGAVRLDTDRSELGQITVWHPAAVSGAPKVLDTSEFPRNAGGGISVRLETLPDDPLDFEIDPLQSLFPRSGP